MERERVRVLVRGREVRDSVPAHVRDGDVARRISRPVRPAPAEAQVPRAEVDRDGIAQLVGPDQAGMPSPFRSAIATYAASGPAGERARPRERAGTVPGEDGDGVSEADRDRGVQVSIAVQVRHLDPLRIPVQVDVEALANCPSPIPRSTEMPQP